MKMVFLKISQNYQKACVGVSILVKLQASITKDADTPTQVFFAVFCEIFKNNYFVEHLWTAAFVGVSLWGSHQQVF